MTLTPEQRTSWETHGFVHLRGFLTPETQAALCQWVEELEAWPEAPGKWMKWYEGSNRQLCRVENFLPYHRGFADFLEGAAIGDLLLQLMGERAVLFKEKINYKLPGGSGFGAHQDAPAFVAFGQTYHITMLVSIDPSTPDNGCLEMVHGHHDQGLLPQNEGGELDAATVASLDWVPLPTEPGDVVFFDSYVPHRSQPNRSQTSRRALYITYNRERDGRVRDQYFAKKRAAFPPECEREEGVDYTAQAAIYNLGNPIK
jgi:ectoine hydroxylase-related dioxygenase (phytanoyl-CoA dioxygenase family)